MKLNEFFENYDLAHSTVKRIVVDNNAVTIDVEMDIYFEYMSNGQRPSFDYAPVHRFKFIQSNDFTLEIENPQIDKYFKDDKGIHLEINNQNIILTDCKIEVKPNIEA